MHEIASAMHGFYVFVKFCLVLICILKLYFKVSSSILFRKKKFNSLLAFFFWKARTFSIFERCLCCKSRNYSLKNFLWDLFISNYSWLGYYFYIISNVRNVQFGLCPIRIFFFFLSSSFLFLLVFSLTDTSDSEDSSEGRWNHPLMNIQLVHRDFSHFFLLDLFVITRLIADETCFP